MKRTSFLQFESDDQLCTSWRKRVAALPESPEKLRKVESSQSDKSEAKDADEKNTSEDIQGTSAGTDALFISPDHEISVLNEFLSILGKSPIINRKLDTRALYVKGKKSRAEVGKRCINQKRKARRLKQADMQSTIVSSPGRLRSNRFFFTILGAMLESNRLFVDRFGRDAWELKGYNLCEKRWKLSRDCKNGYPNQFQLLITQKRLEIPLWFFVRVFIGHRTHPGRILKKKKIQFFVIYFLVPISWIIFNCS